MDMARCLETHLAYKVWIAFLRGEFAVVVNTLFAPGTHVSSRTATESQYRKILHWLEDTDSRRVPISTPPHPRFVVVAQKYVDLPAAWGELAGGGSGQDKRLSPTGSLVLRGSMIKEVQISLVWLVVH
ncbi:unnamed protein product [Clonostachys byssicola]|uniref:Uncharacterized protein n=1 Tax=Clonostachys byssicola TaxID=160290 RepID=A0A9N9UM63_9HYPO|nr:unnamed protein product [Clonostachys byssicola]